ncbi:hypothetical protein HMPREF9120_01873 [Neisseria sp. oral taxon 020 str. F0370]|nr:hypothetical protein HMPREF9120_01873 [Neisseria sp. oral taxon 020 str. F0370]
MVIVKQHENLRRCCALSYYSYCLRLAALYLSVLFHYKTPQGGKKGAL